MTEIASIIIRRLKSSDLWGKSAHENDRFFKGLTCPECGKPESWVKKKQPFTVRCNRKNQCGANIRTLDLFPEILHELEEQNQPTKEDPHRPARAYLNLRGLHKALDGLVFEYWPNVRNLCCGAIMFPVGDAWNGRLLNPPPGEGKTHNRGSTSGKLWKHPGLQYDPGRETLVTEGASDALSLIEMDLQAVAVLSAGADPGSIDFGDLGGKLTFAFDCDRAGGEALKRWRAKYPEAGAITTTRGDWNDLLVEHGDEARAYFDEHRKEFETRAKLQLTRSAQEYAETWHGFYQYAAGLFDHGREMWFSSVKKIKDDEEIVCHRVGNFTLAVDHFQREALTPDEPAFRYHLVILPKSGHETKCTLAGSDLAQSGNLRAALLTKSRVLWEGDQAPTMALARKITASRAPVVRQIRVTGNDDQSGLYVFRDFAISRAGSVLQPDKRGFFQSNSRELLRPPSFVTIKPEPGISVSMVYKLTSTAWPGNGPLAIANTVGSWFVEDIRPAIGFYPFLSLYGDAQTGKTGLIQTLNRCQCLDEEGLNMLRTNTAKGELRKLAQRAGLFVALLEANDLAQIRFNMDTILSLFNYGNPLQTTALKTMGLETREVSFRAALVFVQNGEPFTTRAQRERVVSSSKFETAQLTPSSKAAYQQLMKIPARKLAHFFVEVMERRVQIERTWPGEYEKARDDVFAAVSDNRISEFPKRTDSFLASTGLFAR